jgi:dihydroorotase
MTKGREGELLNEYDELKDAGAVAVTDDGSWVSDGAVMRRVIEYARTCGLLPLSHPEDTTLSMDGQINEGRISLRMGLRGVPKIAEESAIYRDIGLSKLTGSPVHICHVSSREGVDLVRRAKDQGVPVTCETAPHYLFLTEEEVLGYDTLSKINPPLRTLDDLTALREAIKDGTIDLIASDHAPHSYLDKECEFQLASFGAIGLETIIPLSLTLGREIGLSPIRISDLISVIPSKTLNLPYGLKSGNPADITVIDPRKEWVYDKERVYSKSRNSPFLGYSFKGKAVITFIGGEYQAENPRMNEAEHTLRVE